MSTSRRLCATARTAPAPPAVPSPPTYAFPPTASRSPARSRSLQRREIPGNISSHSCVLQHLPVPRLAEVARVRGRRGCPDWNIP
ncbi:hypothetical protein LshimejAT787_0309780 [Lyophyllum shimeji]|uniref:Uncharacterized protein n=1 Tax=Lyophyllum shimeji TaxID=47721 RepID=A0A9P3PJS5_LYOSH|nr:hypothetical protein LshimejAT787_0309780 [Lyophyllum shimeji]